MGKTALAMQDLLLTLVYVENMESGTQKDDINKQVNEILQDQKIQTLMNEYNFIKNQFNDIEYLKSCLNNLEQILQMRELPKYPFSKIEKIVYDWSSRQTRLKDSDTILETLVDYPEIENLTEKAKEYINRKFRESLGICKEKIDNPPEVGKEEKDKKYWGRAHSRAPKTTADLLEEPKYEKVRGILNDQSKKELEELVQYASKSEFGFPELIQKISDPENDDILKLIDQYVSNYGFPNDPVQKDNISKAIVARFETEIKKIQVNNDPSMIIHYKNILDESNVILSNPTDLFKKFCDENVIKRLLNDLELCKATLEKQNVDSQNLMRDLVIGQLPVGKFEKLVYDDLFEGKAYFRDCDRILENLIDIDIKNLTDNEKEYINKKFRESLDFCKIKMKTPPELKFGKDDLELWRLKHSRAPGRAKAFLEHPGSGHNKVREILDDQSKDMLTELVKYASESEFGFPKLIQKISDKKNANFIAYISAYVDDYGFPNDSLVKDISNAIIIRFETEIKEITENNDPNMIIHYKNRLEELNILLSKPTDLLKKFCGEDVIKRLLSELELYKTALEKQNTDSQNKIKKDLDIEAPPVETSKRYTLERFKKVSEVLSPKKRLELDEELKKYQNLQSNFLSGDRSEEINEEIKKIEDNLKNILKNMETLTTNIQEPPTRRYSLDPREFVKTFKNVCSYISELITITGDQTLKREYERVRKEFNSIERIGEFSTSQKKSICQKLLDLLPAIYRAAINFMITLKASYHQVEGYDNLVSRISKRIWKPKN
jgi:hypothetical protein